MISLLNCLYELTAEGILTVDLHEVLAMSTELHYGLVLVSVRDMLQIFFDRSYKPDLLKGGENKPL